MANDLSEPIAYVEFIDGHLRPIFETDGQQYVVADDGEPVYGVWFIPPEESDVPSIVPASPTGD